MSTTLPLFDALNEKTYPPVRSTASLEKVFSTIEMPLLPVLMHMEQRGILIDPQHLNHLAQEVEKKQATIEQQIYQQAGQRFNINSGQQLAGILFEKLGLKPVKKTKTNFSTDAQTLSRLHDKHPIIKNIELYRHYEKLLSTYIIPLPCMVNPSTGRVHTSYNQAVTTTGRLSSSDPNLQNIPTRTPLGQQIRHAFCAAPGFLLISLDYSQIELRLAAHFSRDPSMLADFKEGKDIHAATALRIFKLTSLQDVTQSQRRIAKAINFATIYGAGPRKLAENAHITVPEAKQFMDEYFHSYATLHSYRERLIQQAVEKGYAETFFGRTLFIPDINSNLPQYRAAAERLAINMPLQGTAADIMKKAMIAVFNLVNTYIPDVWMILQVHDELVLEVKTSMVSELVPQIKTLMEQVVSFEVELLVDVKQGLTWGSLQPL